MTSRASIGLLVAMLWAGATLCPAAGAGGAPSAAFLDSEIAPPLVLQDVEVTEAITTLMQRYDMPVRQTSDEIKGLVAGTVRAVRVRDWLSQLGRIYNFYWYFDGALLEIGQATDLTVKTLSIEPPAVDPFLSDLAEVGMDLAAFPVGVNRRTGTVIVRGPESLQATVKQIAEAAHAEPAPVAAAAPAERPVRIIYGRPLIPYAGALIPVQ